jgi:hypothetical protein
MEHVLSCYFYNPTQPSGKVYAEHTDLKTTPYSWGVNPRASSD